MVFFILIQLKSLSFACGFAFCLHTIGLEYILLNIAHPHCILDLFVCLLFFLSFPFFVRIHFLIPLENESLDYESIYCNRWIIKHISNEPNQEKLNQQKSNISNRFRLSFFITIEWKKTDFRNAKGNKKTL